MRLSWPHACLLLSTQALACGIGREADSGPAATFTLGQQDTTEPSDELGTEDTEDPPTTGDGDGDDQGNDQGDGDPKFDLTATPDAELPPTGPIPTNCAQALHGTSTVGCRFYAVDLDTHDAAESVQFAVVVSNVQTHTPATVTVERKNMAGVWSSVAGPTVVNALDLHSFELPDLHQDKSGKRVGGAYRISADVPIVAYQFNPVDGATSYLSDASMLYPAAAWDHINHVVGWQPNEDGFGLQGAYATIVAAHDGTQVQVTPSVVTLGAGGVPAGQAGVPFMISLDEGDIAEVMTQLMGSTLSGTKIISDEDHPVAVFSGHECAFVPANLEACDHLESQLAGVRSWGTHFIASRMPVRVPNLPEAAAWQVYASEGPTTITFTASPGVVGLPAPQIVLQAGQMQPFYVRGPSGTPGDFEVQSDKPIALVQYMIGGDGFGGIGDPAMVQLAPIEQQLQRYVVLVPDTWINDVAVLTRSAGAPITIDGVPVANNLFVSVANSGYEVARVPVSDGVHVLDGGDAPFSVLIVGYDEYDSYAYLGGTGTELINPRAPA
ncbi:Dipeptide-binding ABC transporter, periplasmic substrate-binding component [Enhygromyxa salina]|uniref:Dipeptide-binding ABC transporter, periplasmic substrate-binding component n=1 Tax=Enhygromyxa salina TaxID=215803 RepID=A0A0C1ZX06_9BACT|nr:IgGFc-binding protein [Enhygromyxa salina]KIG15593.1 Dipeptide-binding ABC transporter, periplasmic substrate-binding component [Enhygromyxa salina]